MTDQGEKMAEKVVTDNFNIYDIFGRFGPGCVFVACSYYCYKSIFSNIVIGNMYLKLIVYLSLSYIIGSINQALARWVASEILNKRYFGGNPRELYTCPPNKKAAVLKHEVSRELAKKIRDIVAGHFTPVIRVESANGDQSSVVQGNVKKETAVKAAVKQKNIGDVNDPGLVKTELSKDEKKVNHFVFGYMTNYLDIKGLAGKNSRINSLVDMSSSVIVTAILCYITWIVTILCHIIPDALKGISGWNYYGFKYLMVFVVVSVVVLFVLISSCKLYRSYIQMRYAIVVYQFAICNEWVKKELFNEISEVCPPIEVKGLLQEPERKSL